MRRGIRALTKLYPCSERWYKWALYDRDPLERWSVGRATLLGDSAHAMLPYLGTGAGMAIEDGCVLAAIDRAGGRRSRRGAVALRAVARAAHQGGRARRARPRQGKPSRLALGAAQARPDLQAARALRRARTTPRSRSAGSTNTTSGVKFRRVGKAKRAHAARHSVGFASLSPPYKTTKRGRESRQRSAPSHPPHKHAAAPHPRPASATPHRPCAAPRCGHATAAPRCRSRPH